ncbi:hypothetical protein JKP88DRAFT_247576 [Tribonema minus]|uniref:Uncharacterized protein n=1 Tax=Tribonema minus TaxID=303371 RepID=A0A835YQD4_9STRA|nr:hypothetical protein JKP88DRAFT_247576 [Tribonema minus]
MSANKAKASPSGLRAIPVETPYHPQFVTRSTAPMSLAISEAAAASNTATAASSIPTTVSEMPSLSRQTTSESNRGSTTSPASSTRSDFMTVDEFSDYVKNVSNNPLPDDLPGTDITRNSETSEADSEAAVRAVKVKLIAALATSARADAHWVKVSSEQALRCSSRDVCFNQMEAAKAPVIHHRVALQAIADEMTVLKKRALAMAAEYEDLVKTAVNTLHEQHDMAVSFIEAINYARQEIDAAGIARRKAAAAVGAVMTEEGISRVPLASSGLRDKSLRDTSTCATTATSKAPVDTRASTDRNSRVLLATSPHLLGCRHTSLRGSSSTEESGDNDSDTDSHLQDAGKMSATPKNKNFFVHRLHKELLNDNNPYGYWYDDEEFVVSDVTAFIKAAGRNKFHRKH